MAGTRWLDLGTLVLYYVESGGDHKAIVHWFKKKK